MLEYSQTLNSKQLKDQSQPHIEKAVLMEATEKALVGPVLDCDKDAQNFRYKEVSSTATSKQTSIKIID